MSPSSRPSVLCVHENPHTLEELGRTLNRNYRVRTATQGFEALRILAEEPVEVVIVDARLRRLNGEHFLAMARRHAPDVARIVVGDYPDAKDALVAINEGEVYRFIVRPFEPQDLTLAIDGAVKRHRAGVAERALLEGTLTGATELIAEILGAANEVAGGRASRVAAIVRAAAQPLALDDPWALWAAATLSQLGALFLPAEVAARTASGKPLDAGDRALIVDSLRDAGRMLRRVPRTERVAGVLDPQDEVTLASTLLRSALAFELLRISMSDGDALAALREDEHVPTEIVDAIAHAVGTSFDASLHVHALADIPVGAVFLRDVRPAGGPLVAAAGVRVTPEMRQRLDALAQRYPGERAYVRHADASEIAVERTAA